MKTLLVPVDFTATCENAVNFAVEWCRKYEYERIILLKTFYDSIFEGLIVSAEYSNVNEEYINRQREDDREQLDTLCRSVADRLSGVKVMTAVSEFPLLRGIFEILQNEKPDLIIVGSDNYSYSSGSIISGNVISIAKTSPVRVLVVPADYTYQPVQQVLLPYNFNMLKDLDKLNSLRSSPLWNNLKLLVLNIDTSQRTFKVPEKFNEAEDKFQNLLKNFEHEIYYTTDKNLINSIANFTKEHTVQLIIALPGKHSFLYRLTHQSISEAIYRNAKQPVLILK
ncbi:MAG TPA: universal stress protein [Segetibacter sp.]|nr:universal stress protein [Segetibacter sp.]